MKKRRRSRMNYRLAGMVLGILVVLVSGVYLVHRFQVSRKAGVIVTEATSKEKAGDFAGAADLWRLYLSVKPENLEVRARYADMLDRGAKTPAEKLTALEQIDNVLRADPERLPLRRRAAALAMDLAKVGSLKFEVARRHLELLEKESPSDDSLKAKIAECFEEEGNSLEAEKAYLKALDLNSKSVDTTERLAKLYMEKIKDEKRANEVWDKLVTVNGKSAQVFLRRANFRTKYGKKGAGDDITRARELAPDDVEVIVAGITADLQAKPVDIARVRGEIERALKLHEKDLRLYRAYVDLEVRANRLPEAIALVRRGLVVNPDELELRGTLAHLLQQSNQFDEAAKITAEMRKVKDVDGTRVDQAVLDYLDANSLVLKKDWVKACRPLENVIPLLAHRPELQRQARLVLGTCYAQIGDNERSKDAFREVVSRIDSDDPAWLMSHLQLAGSLVALGQAEEALKEYALVLPKAPLVSVLIAKIVLGQTLSITASKRNWASLEKALTQAEKLIPDALDVSLMRAAMLSSRGQDDAARTLLEATRDRQPDQIETWLVLSALAGRQGRFKDSEALLADMAKKFGDRVEIRLGRARLFTDRGHVDATPRITELINDVSSYNKEQKLALYSGIVEAYLRIGELKDAEKLWNRVTEIEPDNLKNWTTAFDLAAANNDDKAMTHALDNLRRIQGEDGNLVHLGTIFNIVRQRQQDKKVPLAEAYRHLEKVAMRSNTSRTALARAELDCLNENFVDAAQSYLKAIELGERNPVVLRKAAFVLAQQQRYADADHLIRLLTESGGLTDAMKTLASEVAWRNQDLPRALELARGSIKAGSKKISDQLWLGRVLFDAARKAEFKNKEEARQLTAEAENAYRGALSLSGETSPAWTALIQFFLLNGQKDKAEATFKEYQQQPAARINPLTVAGCLDMLGHVEEARAQYQALLASKPDDPAVLRAASISELSQRRVKEAEPLLIKLSNLKEVAPADAEWARNALGVAIATMGPFREADRALKSLGITADGGKPLNIDERRTNAKVLALQPSPILRKRAVRMFEDLVNEKAALDSDRYLLAQLYDIQGEWSQARDLMLLMLTSEQPQPDYVAYFADRLLVRDESNEAAAFVEKMEKLEPNSLRTAGLKARLLHALGKNLDAVARLDAFLKLSDKPRDAAFAAELFEKIQIPSPAEKLYKQLSEKPGDPVYVLAYAGFLGRQGRLKEAIDVCESVTGKASSAEISATALKFLFAAKIDEVQGGRFEQWLKREIAKDPAKTTIQFDLANLYILMQRYDDAAAIYRKYCGSDAKESLALNNLAWLLALHPKLGDDALALINRAIEIEGPRPELLDTRGLVYLKRNQADKAIEDLKESTANLTRPETYLHMAQAYMKLNDKAAATEAMTKARAAGLKLESLDRAEQDEYSKLLVTTGEK